MKTRLVLWGTDEKDDRVLLALALNAKENKVDIWTFPEQVATETLYNRLMNEWRMGREVPFPNVFIQIERSLTLSEPILPDNIKVERPDLLQRAQTEWQFVVLSSKLFDTYQDELEHLKSKIDELDGFNSAAWEELKGFWNKVQNQIYDKNLFREHARTLRDETNLLFSKLKEMRKSFDDEFKKKSKENARVILEKLRSIEERLEQGLGLQPLFEELKRLQQEYRKTDLSRDDRSKIWTRLDKLFKDIKERRFGPGHRADRSPVQRLQRRYDGLLDAIKKMKRSIERDKREKDFQDRKIEQSGGQLEAQIRQAKLQMINDRIQSKEAKLAEMEKTRVEVEHRLNAEKEKEVQRKEKEGAAADPGSQAERETTTEPAEESAEASSDQETESSDTLVSGVATVVSESLIDVADTVRAVADVVADKIGEAIQEQLGSSEEE